MNKSVFKKLINIVPVEDTFFSYVEKPKTIKLSKEVIILNYRKLSPFESGDLIYLQTKKYIYLWFTRYKLPEKQIHIPEGYLIYKEFHNKKEAVIIYNKLKNKSILTVIKDYKLVSQIVSKKENLEKKVDFLIKEHSLKNPEKITIEKVKTKPSILDIIHFSSFEINKENLLELSAKFILMPVSIFLTINGIFYLFMDKYLKEEINQKRIYHQQLKNKTKDIKLSLYELEEEQKFWENFIEKEKKYPSFHFILNELAKILKENNGYINRLEFEGNFLSLWAGLNGNTSFIVQSLLKTGLFKEIKILSSTKDREKEGYEIVNMEIYLK